MAAIDVLQTAWEAKIATISDELRAADATFELESLIAAKVKLAEAQAQQVASYSITGRTVTRKPTAELSEQVASIERKLITYVYGSHDLADMNTTADIGDS